MTKLERWISCWIELGAVLIGIFSLGFYIPSWEMRYMAKCVRGKMKNTKLSMCNKRGLHD